MRFIQVKNQESQGAAMVFRVRELLIRQRTQIISVPRSHLAEFEQVVPHVVLMRRTCLPSSAIRQPA